MDSLLQGVPEKTRNFARYKFSTVDHRIAIFALKYLTKITVYQTMQNNCKCAKYSLVNSRKWLTSSVTSTACKHCSITAEDRLFIKLYELKKAERLTE